MDSIGATPGQRRGSGRGRGRTIAGIIATTLADGVSMLVAQCTVVERPLAHITTTGMVIVNATRAATVACQKDSMRWGTSIAATSGATRFAPPAGWRAGTVGAAVIILGATTTFEPKWLGCCTVSP